MRLHFFCSQSNTKTPFTLNIKVDGSFLLMPHGQIKITYSLVGPDIKVLLFPKALSPKKGPSAPQRKDYLWQATCFECFVRDGSSKEYLEYNIAPNANWNCYHFSDYRMGQNTVLQIPPPILQLERGHGKISAHIWAKLPPFFSLTRPFFNLAMVLQDRQRRYYYLAPKHPSQHGPDFHHVESYLGHVRP